VHPVTWLEDFLTSKWPGSFLYCADVCIWWPASRP